MQCHSKQWIYYKVGSLQKKKLCDSEAVKKCRHGFYTCNNHNHGCKNEETL